MFHLCRAIRCATATYTRSTSYMSQVQHQYGCSRVAAPPRWAGRPITSQQLKYPGLIKKVVELILVHAKVRGPVGLIRYQTVSVCLFTVPKELSPGDCTTEHDACLPACLPFSTCPLFSAYAVSRNLQAFKLTQARHAPQGISSHVCR